MRTRREDKIKMFARMLRKASSEDYYKSVDEYEKYLSILDKLSMEDLFVAMQIDEFLSSKKEFSRFPYSNSSIERDQESLIQEYYKFLKDIRTKNNFDVDLSIINLSNIGLLDTFMVHLTFSGIVELRSSIAKPSKTYNHFKMLIADEFEKIQTNCTMEG